MVKHTLKILQHLMEVFEVSDHFGMLRIKELKNYILRDAKAHVVLLYSTSVESLEKSEEFSSKKRTLKSYGSCFILNKKSHWLQVSASKVL